MGKVVTVETQRTAVGAFFGSLSSFATATLGSFVIENILKRTKLDPSLIDDVILTQVLQAGNGQNLARQVSLKASLGVQTPATTINQICGSGISSVMMAVQSILARNSEIILADRQENISKAPHLDLFSRTSVKLGTLP